MDEQDHARAVRTLAYEIVVLRGLVADAVEALRATMLGIDDITAYEFGKRMAVIVARLQDAPEDAAAAAKDFAARGRD